MIAWVWNCGPEGTKLLLAPGLMKELPLLLLKELPNLARKSSAALLITLGTVEGTEYTGGDVVVDPNENIGLVGGLEADEELIEDNDELTGC